MSAVTSLESLQAADRDALLAGWKARFHCEPPARLHTSLMRSVLAWHLQCEAQGVQPSVPSPSSSSPATPVPTKATTPTAPTSLRPGTRLIREWRGSTHEVHVRAHGFEHAGATYKSLSAIARAITGTPWSGPAFFGLKR